MNKILQLSTPYVDPIASIKVPTLKIFTSHVAVRSAISATAALLVCRAYPFVNHAAIILICYASLRDL